MVVKYESSPFDVTFIGIYAILYGNFKILIIILSYERV